MKQDALQGAEKYTKAHQRKKRWYKVVTGLACVVVFCTVYALILPAITLEKQCDIPEHTHTDDCYTQVTSVESKVPVCSPETLRIHQHTPECYNADGNLICGYANFVVHHHDSACYDENGNLWCPLPEIETHQHTDSCYDKTGWTSEEDDIFTDDSDEWEQVPNSDLPTEPVVSIPEEDTEPVLICEKPEVILHQHTPECYDAGGNLICGKIQVLEHQHTDACFETVEEPVDTEALTCTLPEDENHTHGPRCYGTWELTCGMEEHTHTESCSASTDKEDQSDPGVYSYQDDTLDATVTLREGSALPEGAELRVTVLTQDSEEYAARAAQVEKSMCENVDQLMLFDIGFYTQDETGAEIHLDVMDSATVSILFKNQMLSEAPGAVSVLHFAKNSELPVILENVTVNQQAPEETPVAFSRPLSSETVAETMTNLTFDTEGFSVFAVVKVNSSQAVGEITVTDDTIDDIDGKSYVIVNYQRNRYMANETNTQGIAKKLLSDVANKATLPQWTFTAVTETDGTTTYLIHCDGNYLKMDSSNGNMSFATSDADATHFTVTADKGMFLAKCGNYYINNFGGENTEHFKGYSQPDDGSHLRLYQRDGTTPDALDSQTFAIVNRARGDFAMTAEIFPGADWSLGVPGLKAQQVTVTTGSDGVTYVSGDGVAEWTFHATGTSGVYTISTEVNSTVQYLRFLEQPYQGNDLTRGSVTLDTAENATPVTVTAVGDGMVLLQGAVTGGYLNRAAEGNGFWAARNTENSSRMYLCKKKADSGLIYNLGISGNWSNTPSIPATFQDITEGTFNLYTVENKSVAGTFAMKTTARSNVISYYENYNQALADAGNLTEETYRAPGAEYRFDGWQAAVGAETYLFAENANATLQMDGIHIVDTTGIERTLPSGTTLNGKWTRISNLVMFFVNTGDTMLETEDDKKVTSTSNEHYVQVLATGHIYNPPAGPIVSKAEGGSELVHKSNHDSILPMIAPTYEPNNNQPQIIIDAIARFKNNQHTLEPSSITNESALEEAVSTYLQKDTSRQIKFAGIPIVGSTITTDNYKLYWYKLTDKTGGDAWHIDGALVAKTQQMQIYKMFSGLTSEQVEQVYSRLNISVGLNVEQSDGSKAWSDYIDMNQTSKAGIYTAHGKQGNANIYLWTLNASTAQGYTFKEENYAITGYDHSSIISVHYKDGKKEFVQNTDTTYDSENMVSKFPRGIKGGDATSVIFANFYTPTGTGAFNITKQDPNGNRLANAEFTLAKIDGSGSNVTQTTNQNGSAYFSNLAAGTYTLSETNVPEGYENPGKTWIVEVKNTDNLNQVSSVTIYDTDGNGNKTGDGTNLFTRAENGAITMNLNYVITNMPAAQTLTIIKYFSGITEEELKSISDDYSIQLTDSQNTPKKTLKLSDGVLITGEMAYRWKVMGLTPNEKYTLTESNYSHLNYKDIVVAARISRNVETNGTTQTISEDLSVRKENGTASIEVEKSNTADIVTLTNNYTNAFQLKLKKVNDANETLSGAKFYIYGSFDEASMTVPDGVANRITYTDDGKVNTAYYIGTIGETSADGIAIFDGLKFTNTYVIVEAKAPDGYVKSDQPIAIKAVTQRDDYVNGVYTHIVTNTSKAQAKVTVTAEKTWTGQTFSSYPEVTLNLYRKKADGTAEKIATSTLDGIAVKNNTENSITTNSSGWTVTWSGLPYAESDGNAITYYVAETPIDGFATSYSTTVTSLTIDGKTILAALAEGTDQARSVTVTNTTGYELPDTGGTGILPHIMGGLLLIIVAGSLLLYRYNKRRRGI